MPGEGNEQPVKKAKIHSLRKFDDKIAVQKQRQEETDEQFKEAMRNIGQMKDPMCLTNLVENLPLLTSGSVDLSSPQNSNIMVRSPPTSNFQRPGRLEWEVIQRDMDEIGPRKYNHTKRGSGRRRSTGHASNDIRNSTSPYPVIYQPMVASHPPQFPEIGVPSNLITRVKSDSDLRNSLEALNIESPIVVPTTDFISTPTPEHSLLPLPQHVPHYWSAAKHRHTMGGHGPARKPISGLRKRSHNSSEEGPVLLPPTSTQHYMNINPRVTSLPDLTDITFHSGLDNPLDCDEFSNVTNYAPNEHMLNSRTLTPQQHAPTSTQFSPEVPPLFQQQQPHNRILTQANQFGYFDDAYLHFQSEPHFNSGSKKMFNSSLSIPESHPLSYAFPQNPSIHTDAYSVMQRSDQVQNRVAVFPENFQLDLPTCTVEESVISEPVMDLYNRDTMYERPTSSRSMPSHPHSRDFSQSQQFRGLDLHSTTAGSTGGYFGYDQIQAVNNPPAGLMLNPNLHKSDPLLQSIVAEGNVIPNLTSQMGFPEGILDFGETPIGPDMCIQDELQFGALRKGHSYDFKTTLFGGNKTPVPGSYTNLSKFSSFPEMMSDGVLNTRDPRGHSQTFQIDNNDSVIDRLLEHDACSQFNNNPIPEDAQKFFQQYERDPNLYSQNNTFDESLF
ncbi:hypothetical protein LOD99_4831 [Oopsacas minuta]|uniref:Transducer of regulated CREB activity N-terminal domain-containing protein n=1 Tax=Oopsacas minuta TaxID=111878 RepID=A0AAV7JT22_9METZ|nr:hypothetical protein LOD99_4831 [Oopsacas minuta]